ncbi:Ribosomal protein L24 [Spironucleus salmonicida]|uniref:Ribosomal protein L24 n=1 Tax=Spironucleus salmonicida TaxID=348837 RepID=V6LZL8_9EUKA|nr:Ribosomal protein L24 [Spironucleus salmonicida]|eukprot:EST46289.1 Ribosomal protein L24 [Spironucleus salmonicida]
MVLTTTCNYSGRQILPGYGKRFAKLDKSLVIFINRKSAVHFISKWNPRRIRWTSVYRRLHGKEINVSTKKTIQVKAVAVSRGYVGIESSKLDELRKKYLSK